ncbi:FUN14 domain-containing protein [Gloeobacter kilaueensis]|uniref:FUN14 family superfamily protein n=1 Tax=Gloeobacter kilaueensis (strain ATCC BAA-2537 / CCAP 1431/1 / ULC 316 / JS1) TaxID=1183438 RepID=U5QIL2_GLOK1|nr:FUN14 domain-containing protein [Gloeobacter kilaueensis]AGY58728.1 FUN14 family superfamily protein [Gloeobacter kilaueensis JS1]
MEQLSSAFWLPWAMQLGAGVLSGLAVGFTLRKIALFVLFIVGFGLLFVFGLTQLRIATVNWSALDGLLQQAAHSLQEPTSRLVHQISLTGAGFAGGVLLGWRLR